LITPDPKERLSELERRCAAAGLPVTTQRRAVMEILVGRRDHPTADQIFGAVAERVPDVSRATVYRALDTLTELGLLQRVAHPGSSVRFDGNTNPHHHFLCSRCGAIEDLPLDAVRGHDELAFVGSPTLQADEIGIQVRGLCGRCSDPKA